WCRIAERAFTNVGGLVVLAPILTIMAWRCGHVWSAPLYGVGMTALLLALIATAHTLFDTGLRLALAPSRLRNLHAAVSIVSPLPILLVTSMGLPDNTLVLGWAAATPDWSGWLPGGLAVRALAAADGAASSWWLGLMAAEIAAVTAGGLLLARPPVRQRVG